MTANDNLQFKGTDIYYHELAMFTALYFVMSGFTPQDIRFFGSRAHGCHETPRPDSDIDVVVFVGEDIPEEGLPMDGYPNLNCEYKGIRIEYRVFPNDGYIPSWIEDRPNQIAYSDGRQEAFSQN